MRKKVLTMIFIIAMAVLFNINYTQAYTYKKAITLETIKGASRADIESHLKSKYGSSSDFVVLLPSGNSVVSLTTSLQCVTIMDSAVKVQVGKRKKYKFRKRYSKKNIW